MKKLDLSVFPKVDRETWDDLAKKQLKGSPPSEVLSWQIAEDISVQAYYDPSDLQGLEDQINVFQSLPNHKWKLYQEVYVKDEKKANESAIKALMGGCDGIIFRASNPASSKELLKGINSEICDLSFVDLADDQITTDSKVAMTKGNCLFESASTSSPLDQLVELINLTDQSFIYRNAFTDFFLEIATLRALRFILNIELNKSSVKIHSNIPTHIQSDHQWFLNTSAGLASILGGSHSVSFTTSTGDERISRNVGNLIREESGIAEYTDQCGGSYYIEVLTQKLIEETLKKAKL